MTDHFHNTTDERGAELERGEAVAATQDELVLAYFMARPGQYLTASEVWEGTGMKAAGVPITSPRRAISNLTARRKLIASKVKRKGPWGRPEYCSYYPVPLQPSTAQAEVRVAA